MELCILTSSPRWSQTSPLFCVHFSTTLLAFTGKFSPKCKKNRSLQPSKHINVESTWKQRWLSTFINVVSTLIFGWKWTLSRRTFIDVVSTLAKQRWNILDRITSIQRRWTNVVSTLKFGWKWKLSRPMFIGIASTLSKHHLNNFINCCTNVH